MKTRTLPSICAKTLAYFFAFSFPLQAMSGLSPDGTLNKEYIKTAYYEGEFEPVIQALEAYRKNPVGATKADSIFMYKYLAVIYASDIDTRKKGKAYMYQLVKLMPSMEILDMYVSSEIEAIFSRVKLDYNKRTKYIQRQTGPGDATPMPNAQSVGDSAQSKPLPPKNGPYYLAWAMGGVAVAGVVTTFILISSDKGGTEEEVAAKKPSDVRLEVIWEAAP